MIFKICDIWQHVKYPEKVTSTDSVITMKQIIDEVLLTMDYQPEYYEGILQFCSPCSLPKDKYLTVVLHIGIVEVDIKHQNKVLPTIAHLGFRDSHKGSWFAAVNQDRFEGDLVEESAVKAGFKR